MSDKPGRKERDKFMAIEEILNDLEKKGVISRRAFNKALLGAGLTLGVGGPLLTSCRKKRHGEARAAAERPTEKRTLHFDLSQYSTDHQHTLHVAGARYIVTPHNADTLSAAKQTSPGLANYPDHRITHFATDVELSAERPQRFHVTSKGPRGNSLASVALHIPTASREAARAARLSAKHRAKAQKRADDPSTCTIEDEVSDDFHTSKDTAKAILFHHPEIMNLDPDKAAIIEDLMDGSAALTNLANVICSQGPAYEEDPAYADGWAVLVPMKNDDGSAKVNSKGEQMYDYLFSDSTNTALKDAVKDALKLIKDDTRLAGSFDVTSSLDNKSGSSTFVQYNDPTVNAGATAAAAARMRTADSSGVSLSSSSPGWNNLVYFGETDVVNWNDTERSFTINVNNMAFIWYGIYVQYQDADNNGVAVTDSNLLTTADTVLTDLKQDFATLANTPQGGVGMTGMPGPNGTPPITPIATNPPVTTPTLPVSPVDWFSGLETDTIRFVDIASAPGTVLGLPIPNFPTQLEFKLPDGAVKARIMFCGPGIGGHLDHWETVLIGSVLTLIVQYAIPTYFLCTASGENEDVSLKTLLKTKSLWLKVAMVAKSLVSGIIHRDTARELAIGSAIEGLATKAVDVVLQIVAKGLVIKLAEWLVAKFAEEAVEENVPFAGWALRLLSNISAIGDMVATTAEIVACPLVIENTVSFSQDVTVTVLPDPAHNVFPLTATTLEATITIGTRTFTNTISLSSADLAASQLTITLTGIPSTAKDEHVEVRLYSATRWLAANSANLQSDNTTWIPGPVAFTNKPPAGGGAITASVTLQENPVPITATTQYSHHQKLIYSGGKYQWQYSSTKPTLETLSCTAANGLCSLGNISLWVPGGMIGYSWRASSTGVSQCGGNGSGQLYTFRNVSFKADPTIGMKSPGCGFNDPAPVAYDPRPGSDRKHYFLDPVNTSTDSPEYHLRRIVLDATTPIDTTRTQSWGRFRIPLDRLAVHPGGYVVGISTANHKMGVLRIPDAAYTSDAEAMNSALVLGEGTNSDRLVYRPMALTINRNGVILVLEGGDNKRIKAFNTDGSPCKFFSSQTSSVMALASESGNVTWLDLAIDPTDLMFVLSFTGAGANVDDYRLDVYKTDGTHVVRNTGIAVARMTVDPWRNLYSLNQETIAGAPAIEPSVSLWTPSTP